MIPTLWVFDTHSVFVGLGAAVAILVFVLEARRLGHTDERVAYIATGGLVGGAVFMRLGTWAQHLDPRANASLVEQWLYGNRSVLGGLLGAWLGVHVVKRLTGYRRRTGDVFAPAVAAGMAVGRVGCFLTEAPGTPTGAGWGMVLDPITAARVGAPAGVALHPSFLYEIAFHALAFAVLWGWARHQQFAPGETFVAYIAAYAIFRFGVEFVRGNEVVWHGLTRPQLFLAVTAPLLVARVIWLVASGRLRPRAGAAIS